MTVDMPLKTKNPNQTNTAALGSFSLDIKFFQQKYKFRLQRIKDSITILLIIFYNDSYIIILFIILHYNSRLHKTQNPQTVHM